jgi:uncharacterized protein (DUF305 family)
MTWLLGWIVVSLFVSGAVLADEPADGRNGRAELRFLEGMIDHHQMALDMAQDCLAKAESDDVLTLCQAVIDAQSAEISLMQGWLRDWYQVDYAPVSMLAGLPEDAAPMSGMEHDMDSGAIGDMMHMDHADAMGDMMEMDHADAMGDMSQETDPAEATEPASSHDHETHTDTPEAGFYTDPPMTMGMMAGLNRLEGHAYDVAWLEAMIDHHDDALHMANRLLLYVQHEELGVLAETIIADQTAEIAAMEALLSEHAAH